MNIFGSPLTCNCLEGWENSLSEECKKQSNHPCRAWWLCLLIARQAPSSSGPLLRAFKSISLPLGLFQRQALGSRSLSEFKRCFFTEENCTTSLCFRNPKIGLIPFSGRSLPGCEVGRWSICRWPSQGRPGGRPRVDLAAICLLSPPTTSPVLH